MEKKITIHSIITAIVAFLVMFVVCGGLTKNIDIRSVETVQCFYNGDQPHHEALIYHDDPVSKPCIKVEYLFDGERTIIGNAVLLLPPGSDKKAIAKALKELYAEKKVKDAQEKKERKTYEKYLKSIENEL